MRKKLTSVPPSSCTEAQRHDVSAAAASPRWRSRRSLAARRIRGRTIPSRHNGLGFAGNRDRTAHLAARDEVVKHELVGDAVDQTVVAVASWRFFRREHELANDVVLLVVELQTIRTGRSLGEPVSPVAEIEFVVATDASRSSIRVGPGILPRSSTSRSARLNRSSCPCVPLPSFFKPSPGARLSTATLGQNARRAGSESAQLTECAYSNAPSGATPAACRKNAANTESSRPLKVRR